MFTINRTTDYEVIKEILQNPRLYKSTYGQSGKPIDINEISKKEWLLIKKGKEVVGGYEIREVTEITLEAHMFILPKYWRESLQIIQESEDWCKENKYKIIFTSVPKNCIHMLKFVHRMGYTACGQIANGIIYNGVLTTLFLFNKII